MEDNLRENLLIVERIYDDCDEEVDTKPVRRIANAPVGLPIKDLKSLLDQTGYSNYRWGLNTIEREEDWHCEALSGYPEDRGLRNDDLNDMSAEAYDLEYEELVDRLNGEKRITLRLPNALHYALAQAAGKETLNSYCIKLFADAVDYGDKLDDFEKKRNKPGRPKKVQDAE